LEEAGLRQLETKACSRCEVESLDLEDFFWWDEEAQLWRSGPVCRDRQACAKRREAGNAY